MHVKILSYAIVITLLSIFMFGLIYIKMENLSFIDSMYHSVMIQTLVGIQENTVNKDTKIVMSVQALISYIITTGFVVFVARSYAKK